MSPVLSTVQVPLPGYVTFNSSDENPLEGGGLCYRDVTSPINDRDVDSSSSSSRGMCAPPRWLRAPLGVGSSRALPPTPQRGPELWQVRPVENEGVKGTEGPGFCEEQERGTETGEGQLLAQCQCRIWGTHSKQGSILTASPQGNVS